MLEIPPMRGAVACPSDNSAKTKNADTLKILFTDNTLLRPELWHDEEVAIVVTGNYPRYLITPRSLASMNRISISTSSPRSCSDFNFSSAWVVFSLEVSRTL